MFEPSGVAEVQSGWPDPYYVYGAAGAGGQFRVVMAPTTVSFSRVSIRELPGPATSIWGYFTTGSSNLLQHTTAGNWFPLLRDNSWTDTVWSWKAPFGGGYPQIWSNGGFTWVIPAQWKIGSGPTNSMSGWSQIFNLESSGTVKITKFGNHFLRRTIGGSYDWQ